MALACRIAIQAVLIVSILFIADLSSAINIVVNLQNKGMNPAFDPTGSRLLNMFQQAKLLWEDYLPESGTYTVGVYWDNTMSSLGQYLPFPLNEIRINATENWFIDPTPLDHSEFDFETKYRVLGGTVSNPTWVYKGGQWLYDDVDSSEQNSWFTGNPQDRMEIGYRGWASEPSIQSQDDLLSTVSHELGHKLGINFAVGDWDADPTWLDGSTTTIRRDGSHIAAQAALMCDECATTGTRRLPSAVDIMAVAVDEGMTVIDLPRKDFWGGTSWSTPSNWEGNSIPDADDDAYVRHGGVVTLAGAGQVENLLVDEGSTLQVSSGANALTVDKQLTIGKISFNSTSLVSVNAGQLSTYLTAIGDKANSIGRIRVDSLSRWANTTDVYVGKSGDGTLAIDGGLFSTSSLYLGYESTGSGRLDLSQNNTATVSVANNLVVGRVGIGIVTHDVGALHAAKLTIGDEVNGNGSYLLNNGTLSADAINVGYNGTGSLSIQAGGVLTSGNAEIGSKSAAHGTVTVNGIGSKWNVAGDLSVGNGGTGTLTISSRGMVSALFGEVGYSPSGNGTVNVRGAGTTWNITQELLVGWDGVGAVDITQGGAVSSLDGSIGLNRGHGSVTVDGAGSTWTSNTAYIGRAGTGAMIVRNGGQVSSTAGLLGVDIGSFGAVTVDGVGSIWTNNGWGELTVGGSGTGTLDITNGGHVSSAWGSVGSYADSTGAVTVAGAGSTWTTGNLLIGGGGTGALTIRNGAIVSSSTGGIAGGSTSTGTVIVEGTGSTWNNSSELYVGDGGSGTLIIIDEATVSNTRGVIGGSWWYDSTGAGAVTVSGSGSTWNNSGELYVGRGGSGSLTIQNAGIVSNTYGYIGWSSSSSGTVSVDGASSTWNNSVGLSVGHKGFGTLTITRGATVSNIGVGTQIGVETGSNGDVIVDGAGTNWNNSGQLEIGVMGSGLLTIRNGGTVTSASGYCGFLPSATGTVTVDGSGSTWNNTGNLFVGYNGAGNLRIQNGGRVNSYNGMIFGLGTTSNATVNGPGSVWNNSNSLLIGDFGSSGMFTLVLANDGTVSALNITVGTRGEIHGNGNLIGELENNGIISPGTSLGVLNLNGNYTQALNGELQIELASLTGYDKFLLSGTSNLGGKLSVHLLDGFAPSLGDVFEILTALDGVTGTFDVELLPALTGNVVWNVVYSTNSVSLVVVLPGDFNFDGTVDAADYVVWRKGLGTTYTQDCYDVWRAHFGQTASSGAIANETVAEPASLVMLIVAAAHCCLRGCRAAKPVSELTSV